MEWRGAPEIKPPRVPAPPIQHLKRYYNEIDQEYNNTYYFFQSFA